MYPFNKAQQEDRSWSFELDGINMVLDDFYIKDDCHWIQNPKKAIAYFNIEGNLYGLSNLANTKATAEEFYDIMFQQYSYFNTGDFSEEFFITHGFYRKDGNWFLTLTDYSGQTRELKHEWGKGWFYDGIHLKKQPENIGDIIHFYTEKTGNILKRIS